MQIGELIDRLPLWGLFAATVMVVVLSVEAGFQLGMHRRRLPEHEIEAPVGAIVGAMLGLLAFILAFTFGLASSRFEARRGLILSEANAIGTSYLRAALLPDPQRTEIRNTLREYTDVRLTAGQPEKIEWSMRRSEELQTRLWSQAVEVAQKKPGPIAGLFIGSLNEVIDMHAKRVTVGRSRIPGIIWAVLYVVTVLSMGTVGYYSGLSSTRRSLTVLALVLAFSAVMLLVADLDRPLEGLLKANQQPLLDLRNSITASRP